MKITRLNHAALNVHNRLDDIRAFYQDFLGIPETPRPSEISDRIDGFWLQLSNAQIHIIDAALDDSPHNPVGPHTSYYVEDINAAIEDVKAKGLTYTKFGKNHRQVIWFSDPLGNTVELQQDPDIELT